jgi:hypothetical protein
MIAVTYEIYHKHEPTRIVTVRDGDYVGRKIINHLREEGKLHVGAQFAGCKVIEITETKQEGLS